MSYLHLISEKPEVLVQTEKNKVPMTAKGDHWAYDDLRVETAAAGERMHVRITAQDTPICRVWLVWNICLSTEARVLGDAWERGYGDLHWSGIVPERIMPWYVLIHEDQCTHGYGVETGPGAMCFWMVDRHQLRLCLDVRNGGSGVLLHGRTLAAATIICRKGSKAESSFEAARDFCKKMCAKPRLPKSLVYGSNNWYYAYGNSSAEQILQDARLLAELTEGIPARPYMVIDDGWQMTHATVCSGGPWNQSNYRFPDMAALARKIRELSLRPGLWFRPLTTVVCYPQEYYLPRMSDGAKVLDPSHPKVLEEVEKMTRGLVDWGYELLKHDFTTYDIFGRWGFEMGNHLTDDNWHFYDRSKTTAEIILGLYRAIRHGAGEDTIIIGCNTVSHLAAGLFELQRTGDDTSGVEWERTRKMGVNTLAFRMPQHGAFYACDADCVGITGKIEWTRNREWLSLLALSGTPMFVSADPGKLTSEQKQELREAYLACASTHDCAEPLDWMHTTCPEHWRTEEGLRTFAFPVSDQPI